MATTIQVSEELKRELEKLKLYPRESYENVIWDLLEANMELSEETKKELEKAYKDIEEGRVYTHEEVKKELGL